MRFRKRNIGAVLLALTLAAQCLPPSVAGKNGPPKPPAPSTPPTSQQDLTGDPEQKITERDDGQNGITVSEPKIYDDALLQQMLRTAEARLAALQVIDQASIVAKLGSITGASERSSSVAFNVQGAPMPGVVTTKGPDATTGDLVTQSIVTTDSAFNPPTATAPAPTTAMPSSFSVSSSDILNEQMQLTAEINGLRLLLAGSLTDYFMKHRPGHAPDEDELPKMRTTLGFHVAVSPREHYKDAVAIVEVEVSTREIIERSVETEVANAMGDPTIPEADKPCPRKEAERKACIEQEVNRRMAQKDLPAVTALIPREKTYNVAAITDKSTSIGGGVATQILGFSGSWVRGHKTYYLVQDQDTVALTYRPADGERTGFRWQFRPVLGQRYVKAGLKQTFVQLAFPTLSDAVGGEIGQVAVRTYWRKYDRKAGILKGVIPGSYREMYRDVDIPRFKQPVAPMSFNARTGVEDIGGGQALVKLTGRFLPGTYVRIGGTLVTEGNGLKHEYHAIKFAAPISSLATRKVVLVAHNGEEMPLNFNSEVCKKFDIEETAAPPATTTTTANAVPATNPKITPVDVENSLVQTRVSFKDIARADILREDTDPDNPLPWLLFVIGQRVFGYSDAPLRRVVVEKKLRPGTTDRFDEVMELSAVVPNALLVANPRLTVQSLFPRDDCKADASLAGLYPANQSVRVAVLERGSPTRFLLYGDVTGLDILSPSVEVKNIAKPGTTPVYAIELSADQLKANKQLLMRRGAGEPFLLTLPEVEVKKPDPPKARARVTLGADEAIIDGVGKDEVQAVSYGEQAVNAIESVDDKSIRLKGLRALGLTSEVATRTLTLLLKSKATFKVDLEIINSKVETVPR